MIPIVKAPMVMIPPAPADYSVCPKILTDEFLSKIRHRVLEQKDIQQKPIMLLMGGLQQVGTVMQSQIPMMGQSFVEMCQYVRQNLDGLFNNEHTTHDYLTGKGLVGSYIRDNIEMFKACDTVYQTNISNTVADSTITYRKSNPTIECEYYQIFNYNPKPAYVDNVPSAEYQDLINLNRRIQNFIYITRIFEHQKCKEHLHKTTLRTDTFQFWSENGHIEKSGFYRSSNGLSGSVDGLLILIASVRDTKVALVINGLYKTHPSSINRVNLFIKHRAENAWINHSDNSGTFIIDGVYEALKDEANRFFESINWDLDTDPEPIAQQAFKNMHYIAWCADTLCENGVGNSITDILPGITLAQSHIDARGNKLGLLFSFNVNNVVYDIKKTADGERYVTWIGYRRSLTGYGYSPNSESSCFIFDNESNRVVGDEDYITTFLMNELNEYLEPRLPKLKEYVEQCKNAVTTVKDIPIVTE